MATVLPDTLTTEAVRSFLERVESRELPVAPFIGESPEEAAAFLGKIVRAMVFHKKDLGQRGVARDGWTVHLSSEYDFQNLFFTAVKPWLPELGREEVTIEYDGQRKSADFNVFGSQVVLEMKHVKDAGTKAAVVKTLEGLGTFHTRHAKHTSPPDVHPC